MLWKEIHRWKDRERQWDTETDGKIERDRETRKNENNWIYCTGDKEIDIES